MIKQETLDKLEFQKVISFITKYCITENGKEYTQKLTPLTSLQLIIQNGAKVTEAKEILIHNDLPPLEYLPDLTDTLAKSKVEGVVLGIKQILGVLKLAEISRKLFQFLKHKELELKNIEMLRSELFVDKVFEHQLSHNFTENGEIKDDATPRLKEIRNEIRDKELSLRKLVNRLLKQLSDSYLVQEEYITQRDGRIVLPVKAEHKRHVRGFVHSESSTGQTVYIEPEETLELNNEILSLSFAEKREIEKILKALTEKIGQSSEALRATLKSISELDSIFARAKYSIEILGAFPSYNTSLPFHLMDGRHPILIKKIGHNATIPLNLKFENSSVILITGPNAGGKTVTLKTTGLLCLLAQAGIHIPVHPDSNFHYFENILVDIGDAQSIEDDLSTFSSHLTNIRHIIENAEESSLILLDEIGTGTDPTEGAAIATGVLLSLRDKGSKILATTHHGSLKVLADQLEYFQNASMEFDLEGLKPTYKFNQGVPGSSYAFEVAGRIGFDNKFIELSKQYLDPDKTKIEDFLVNLEKKSKKLRAELNKLEIENLRLKSLANLYQEKIDKLEKQKKEILEETKEKAKTYLVDVNKKIESAIKNIRESNAQKEVIKTEKEKISKIKIETETVIKPESPKKTNGEVKVGSYAAIQGTNSVGLVEEIDKLKDRAVLLIGSLKIKARYSELIPSKKTDSIEQKITNYSFDLDNLNYRLDIRGKKYEEAEPEIIKFLDNSHMRGLDRAEILHGKGTGALKQLVQTILKSYRHVEKFYFAGIESGGDGVTIVEFK
ncbi:MAG: endonuclease MutS2 [Bacteroidota bacterium]